MYPVTQATGVSANARSRSLDIAPSGLVRIFISLTWGLRRQTTTCRRFAAQMPNKRAIAFFELR